MMKYYYKANNDIIQYLGKSKKVPKNCTAITKEDYERYKDIIESIEDREGYERVITLYVDFTYSVEYIPIEYIEE